MKQHPDDLVAELETLLGRSTHLRGVGIDDRDGKNTKIYNASDDAIIASGMKSEDAHLLAFLRNNVGDILEALKHCPAYRGSVGKH
jgi:hypothetical protein